MKQTPLTVFQTFGKGLMSGTDVWKEVVADDISFVGPVDQVNGLDAFARLNEGFMPMVKGNTMKQIVEAGDYIITQVEMDVAMPSGKTIQLDMSEWYEIQDGKIQSIKIFYDAEEFRQEMN